MLSRVEVGLVSGGVWHTGDHRGGLRDIVEHRLALILDTYRQQSYLQERTPAGEAKVFNVLARAACSGIPPVQIVAGRTAR
jgi:hypothetical protein